MNHSNIFTNPQFPTTKKSEPRYSLMLKDKVLMEVTLNTILNYQRVRLGSDYTRLSNEQKFELIRKTVKDYTGKNFSYEIKVMFALDAFILNEDRHTNNISFLINSDFEYRFSPIFDNGMSLLSRTSVYHESGSTLALLSKVKPTLLNKKFKAHLDLYDYEPFLYKSKVKEFIEEYREVLGRVYSVINYRLNSKEVQKLFID